MILNVRTVSQAAVASSVNACTFTGFSQISAEALGPGHDKSAAIAIRLRPPFGSRSTASMTVYTPAAVAELRTRSRALADRLSYGGATLRDTVGRRRASLEPCRAKRL
jgi:hypothetical protein